MICFCFCFEWLCTPLFGLQSAIFCVGTLWPRLPSFGLQSAVLAFAFCGFAFGSPLLGCSRHFCGFGFGVMGMERERRSGHGNGKAFWAWNGKGVLGMG